MQRTSTGSTWVHNVTCGLVAANALLFGNAVSGGEPPARAIDFNRQIRPILSNQCFQCHGPDAKNRKGLNKPLRLDTESGALADLGGHAAIVPGKVDESELISRITSDDPNEVMPPASTGRKLSRQEIDTLTDWVRQGAPYARHWSYVKPVRPVVPEVRQKSWTKNAIDAFILARLEREGLKPSAEADRYALIRRVSLDLTGLPPTLEETERFVNDKSPNAYDALVDRLLENPAYGEHWGRMWLDLARYADSAGYADDPPRTIWAYRDYVIDALNANKPFDQFTIEQLAGDLLPNPTEEQLVATAFQRNTLTNNEGGTNDEEFRNVAVVDRVNTTLAVWMGTTIACAQCHDHKYDPFTQEEYFRLFAFFNNTADADRTDETPVLSLFTREQKRHKAALERSIAEAERALQTPTPALLAGQAQWEKSLTTEFAWRTLRPASVTTRSGARATTLDDHSVRVDAHKPNDVYTFKLALDRARIAGLRLETLPDDALPNHGPGQSDGQFVVSRVLATITPPGAAEPAGRYVRIDLPGKAKILSLAEVEVFRGNENIARKGTARQSSTDYDGQPGRAIDGNTNGDYTGGRSTTHTAQSDNPWWEVDLKASQPVDRVVLWNRTDSGLEFRLSGYRVSLLNDKHEPIWTQSVADAPRPRAALNVTRSQQVNFTAAFADVSQPGFEAASVLNNTDVTQRGWSVGTEVGKPHALALIPPEPIAVEPGSTLSVTIEQLSRRPFHTLGRFRLSITADQAAYERGRTPDSILAILKVPAERRTEAERAEVTRHYLGVVAPELKPARDQLARQKAELAALKPGTTVPIFRELPPKDRRTTRIQHRGNFLDQGKEVVEDVPRALHRLPQGSHRDRLALARWLVDAENPLTGRVIANRYWEQLFGLGIVTTSEEFGAQGELPTHPELLDWLAIELTDQRWDLKRFLKLLVTSATYRQSAKVTPEALQRDPDNRLLTRGPRVRLDAEMVRDQALFVSGLLSPKMHGPPVKPPQPSIGLSAAFGSGIDWQTSSGDDRYRRALYTTWRRSNPYPSMATFDAPNREVCTVKRTRTNTPLQALVTLNDPVYVEASQALARRMARSGKSAADKARYGFRLCLTRPPSETELNRLVGLYESARESFAHTPEQARRMATDPLGPAPPGADTAELAAWTVVGNVLLNLDETLMKR
jgi:hypothetical protein